MKHSVIGILAHVDAGKTTLSESMLYTSGNIRHMGRVDHGDAFLDYDQQERNRGITIYSKQAIITWKDSEITLIDTPGHVDFSAEMERTLQVLDYAILVISGTEGVQTHTETIWKLLAHYKIPTFIFVNKMDIAHKTKIQLMQEITLRLCDNCMNFQTNIEDIMEQVALSDDILLEQYMQSGTLPSENIASAIQQRLVYPCFFGSALKLEGIETFLDGLQTYTMQKNYPSHFKAKVYKITRDEQGSKLTHMKITGGTLKVKAYILEEEKVDQIRIYSGNKYQNIQEAKAGQICAVKGLRHIQAGEVLGDDIHVQPPLLSAYMNYQILLPDGCDTFSLMKQLKQLIEEDPQLHINNHNQNEEIHLRVMGEIQLEVLKKQIKERFDIDVAFDQGTVNYKETICEPVEGIGHFEPLRHYAEVHLLLEPGELGSGIQVYNTCTEDMLAGHYQRQIMNHLEEKEHKGVLSGSSITDIKITLLAGKAHLKHTEGGDFKEATYRAVRQGLKATKSILLEPFYQYRLAIPDEYMSKAIYDIESMNGTYEVLHGKHGMIWVTGKAPVANMQNYQKEVQAYTRGQGTLICTLKDYEPCEKQEEIINQIGYDSETDTQNPTGSVFCKHGAGFYVKWNEIMQYMHIKPCWQPKNQQTKKQTVVGSKANKHQIDDEEVKRVFNSIYRTSKPTKTQQKWKKQQEEKATYTNTTQTLKKPVCLLIDGYNIIHSWSNLKELAKEDLEAARKKLIDIISNYQGYKKCIMILVFDAYKVEEQQGSIKKHHNIYVVYTKTSQTADSYIEEATHKMASEYNITVATSDAMEQWIVIGQGAIRMSSRELKIEIDHIHKTEYNDYKKTQKQYRNHALEDIRAYNEKNQEEDT